MLAFKSATELVAMLRDRQISAAELLSEYRSRVKRFDDKINSIIWQEPNVDSMVQDADPKSPLAGLPMTVKEAYGLAGSPTTWGVPELRNNITDTDSVVVARLRAAGATVFGKSNVPLFLGDFQSYNDIYGTTNNPWDKGRTPGGSSGGSAAALAAGLCGLENGSDIGGSIRKPAHFCGVFGHKPTWNLLPPRGHAMPGVRTPADISVIGPLARSARDLETALLVMAGPDEIQSRGHSLALQRLGKPVSSLRVGVWSDDPVAPVSKAVRGRVEAVAAALRDAGATVEDSARPDLSSRASQTAFQFLLQATMSARIPDPEFQKLSQAVGALAADDTSDRANTLRAQAASFRDWSRHNEARTHLRWAWHAFFQRYDVLLTPI